MAGMAFPQDQGARFQNPEGTPDMLDEHIDEACFTIAMALRRILSIEPLDAEQDDEPEALAEEELDC